MDSIILLPAVPSITVMKISAVALITALFNGLHDTLHQRIADYHVQMKIGVFSLLGNVACKGRQFHGPLKDFP